ncbi:hypothetical protein [Metabacillus halosaccharovorans]|nr:hypothetical protein [Metabacillus halosaccharovorans]
MPSNLQLLTLQAYVIIFYLSLKVTKYKIGSLNRDMKANLAIQLDEVYL